MPLHALTLWSSALVAQWIEHGSPKAGVGGSIPLWGTTCRVLVQRSINNHALAINVLIPLLIKLASTPHNIVPVGSCGVRAVALRDSASMKINIAQHTFELYKVDVHLSSEVDENCAGAVEGIDGVNNHIVTEE